MNGHSRIGKIIIICRDTQIHTYIYIYIYIYTNKRLRKGKDYNGDDSRGYE